MIPRTYSSNIILCQLARFGWCFVNDINELDQGVKVNDFKGLGPSQLCKLRPPTGGGGCASFAGGTLLRRVPYGFFYAPHFFEKESL